MSFPSLLEAASTNEARVTRVKNQVQLRNSKNIARSASVNDIVWEQTIVRTGNGSCGEVTFSDQTIVRLAARTAFDFNQGTRGLNLGEGAVLVQSPKEANGATIHAGSVAAAVAGTTVMNTLPVRLQDFLPALGRFIKLSRNREKRIARLYNVASIAFFCGGFL